ncbi:MAG: DNA-processing protein DprA [Bacteroidota bacterium]
MVKSTDERTVFALALEATPGIGRVTAGRILRQFGGYEDVLRYPREQILLRIKGAPRADQLAEALLDEPVMRGRMHTMRERLDSFVPRRIKAFTAADARWPESLDDLPPAHCPNVLYCYGEPALLKRSLIGFFARPPISTDPFELAQTLVRWVMSAGMHPAAGALSGFDVVVHKLAATADQRQPSVIVASSGLAKVDTKMRPHVSAGVKAGGAFVSSFSIAHGPFPHDEREAAFVLAALSDRLIFVDSAPETPEWEAMEWALTTDRRVFGMGTQPWPDGVVALADEVALAQVLA